jgi:hypothetical protein
MPANRELLDLVGGILARRVLRKDAQRKDQAGVVTTGPVSTEIPPCSKEFTDVKLS